MAKVGYSCKKSFAGVDSIDPVGDGNCLLIHQSERNIHRVQHQVCIINMHPRPENLCMHA